MIVGATTTFVARWAASGQAPTAPEWETLGLAWTAGAGFLRAADAKQVNNVKADIKELQQEQK